jgi:hypothetical protein
LNLVSLLLAQYEHRFALPFFNSSLKSAELSKRIALKLSFFCNSDFLLHKRLNLELYYSGPKKQILRLKKPVERWSTDFSIWKMLILFRSL